MAKYITTICDLCGTTNYIPLNRWDAKAWECWACFGKFWLDNDEFLPYNRERFDEEDFDNAIFLCGQSEIGGEDNESA